MSLTVQEKGILRVLEEAMKFDDFAYALSTIDINHRHAHDGFYFHASGRASVGIGANYDLLFAIPAGVHPHLQDVLFDVSDSPLDIKVYEGVTTSADGTVVPVFNRNRNSSNTPGTVLTHTPTVTDLGTQMHDVFVPDAGGTGSHVTGSGAATTKEEWILLPGTKYLVRLTNNSGGVITLSFETKWYEIGYSKIV